MFSFLKKKGNDQIVIAAPMEGKAVSLKEVNDPTFSEGLLGKGIAIIPSSGKVVAPVDGTVELVFDTKHAISMTSAEGVEVLIHVGLDTVNLKGDGYEAHVAAGDAVKKGDLLLTVDLDKIKAAGYDTITPIIICNTDDYEDVKEATAGDIKAGEDAIYIVKK